MPLVPASIGSYFYCSIHRQLCGVALIDKGMKKGDLISVAGISSNIIAKMGRNEYVSMESLEKICISLNCDIGEIVSVEAEVKESE